MELHVLTAGYFQIKPKSCWKLRRLRLFFIILLNNKLPIVSRAFHVRRWYAIWFTNNS